MAAQMSIQHNTILQLKQKPLIKMLDKRYHKLGKSVRLYRRKAVN